MPLTRPPKRGPWALWVRCARYAPWRAAPSASAGRSKLCRSSGRPHGRGGASLCLRASSCKSSRPLPRRLPCRGGCPASASAG
eukprot:14129808-Alexandrium_andersonii.AAC.1